MADIHLHDREPIFNVPMAVVAVVMVLVIVHGIRLVLPEATDDEIVGLFAFSPGRYLSYLDTDVLMPDNWGPYLWGFVSYALLHADLTHLLTNCAMFAAVGNLISRRLGPGRFVAFCTLTAAVSAVGELAIATYQPGPVIGISGVVSALLGAFVRFALPAERRLPHREDDGDREREGDGGDQSRSRSEDGQRAEAGPQPELDVLMRPTGSIGSTLRRPSVVKFVVAFAIANLVLVYGAPALTGSDVGVAWMVHAAGFVAGFLLFPLLDPVGDRFGRWQP